MRALLIAASALALAGSAHAGKEERDYQANELAPAMKDAASALLKGCGCAWKTNVNWDTFKTKDQMMLLRYFSTSVAENARRYCDTAASKKAICQLKTLNMSVGKPTSFVFQNGTGTWITDGQSYSDWDVVAEAVDK